MFEIQVKFWILRLIFSLCISCFFHKDFKWLNTNILQWADSGFLLVLKFFLCFLKLFSGLQQTSDGFISCGAAPSWRSTPLSCSGIRSQTCSSASTLGSFQSKLFCLYFINLIKYMNPTQSLYFYRLFGFLLFNPFSMRLQFILCFFS